MELNNLTQENLNINILTQIYSLLFKRAYVIYTLFTLKQITEIEWFTFWHAEINKMLFLIKGLDYHCCFNIYISNSDKSKNNLFNYKNM